MAGHFRIVTTPAFEREFRKAAKGNPALAHALEELLTILEDDPYNRTGRHQVKKLVGLQPGEGQWRIRWREYRLRYDIFSDQGVLHSFRHRREAY